MGTAARLIAAILWLAAPAWAQLGTVTSVKDGDTVVVRFRRHSETVRLAAIDAPELNQPGGKEAREALLDFTLHESVAVNGKGRDRYGRRISDLALRRGQSAAEHMLAKGWAWHYTRYSKSKAFAELEAKARRSKIGLWGGKDAAPPIPPWLWRRGIREPEQDAPLSGRRRDAASLHRVRWAGFVLGP